MKIIAERSMKTSMKRCGFQGIDGKAHDLVEESLQNFVANAIQKAQKVSSKEGKQIVEEKHMLSAFQGKKGRLTGGAETTLPLEYFGVNSKHYHEDAPLGTDMQVTNSMVRPAFLVNDPAGVLQQVGSSKRTFKISSAAVKSILNEHNVQVRQNAQKLMQEKFEGAFEQVLAKVAKKFGTNELQGSQLQEILNQQKFQKLFKQ